MAYLCCSPDRVSSESPHLLKVNRGNLFVDHIPLCFMSEILNPIDNIKDEISKDSASFCKKMAQEINQEILQNKYDLIDYNTIELRFIPKSSEELRFDFEYVRKSRRRIVPFHLLKFKTHFVKDDLNQRINQTNQNPNSEKETMTCRAEECGNGTNDTKIDARSCNSIESSSKKVVQACGISDQLQGEECNNSRNSRRRGKNEFEQDVTLSIGREQNSNNEGILSSSENHRKISKDFIKTDEKISSKKKHFRPRKMVRKMLRKSYKKASILDVEMRDAPKKLGDEICHILEEISEEVFANETKKEISKKSERVEASVEKKNVSNQCETTDNLVSKDLEVEKKISAKKLSKVSPSSQFIPKVPFQKRYYYRLRGKYHSYRNPLGIYGALEAEADVLRYIRRDIMFILRSHFCDSRFYQIACTN